MKTKIIFTITIMFFLIIPITFWGQTSITAFVPSSDVKVGDNMLDGRLIDIGGNTKQLSDYLGKYILLDFWHSGCKACIMALPTMKQISETHQDKLTIIGISQNTDKEWKEISAKHDIPWINLRDPKSIVGLASNYGLTGFPHYVLISPEGKVIDIWMGFSEHLLKIKVVEKIK